ncbi:hypothetical protein SAY86_016668 [Trapa natans]|uniref:Uncharacterized protein n=1 Tax=Trapa natans TaxID=22666 RepID=A0AAN7QZP4_TRANT|nr:hypothetical protein SAY86_016668 [Trapa natans]
MLSMCVSVKENMKCGSRLTDVAVAPPLQTVHVKDKRTDDSIISKTRVPGSRLVLDQARSISHFMDEQTRLSELSHGDPSRSIIERIITVSIPKGTKSNKKISRVLRVMNPSEILNRFEKHREMVKQMAYLQCRSHPRNLVDGNELLLFYGTTISCCCSSKKRRTTESVTDLCNEPNCRVCRVLRLKFDMKYTRNNGIRLSKNSEVLSESAMESSDGKGVKRAVIVCRTIVGAKHGGSYLVSSTTPNDSPEDIIVHHPDAVLPCFVVVFG